MKISPFAQAFWGLILGCGAFGLALTTVAELMYGDGNVMLIVLESVFTVSLFIAAIWVVTRETTDKKSDVAEVLEKLDKEESPEVDMFERPRRATHRQLVLDDLDDDKPRPE